MAGPSPAMTVKGSRMSKSIPVERSFAEWRKDPKYVEAFEALEGEFSFAATLIESLTDAVAHAQGKPSGVREHFVEIPERPKSAHARSTTRPRNRPLTSRSRRNKRGH
jgi:hypothetical protein